MKPSRLLSLYPRAWRERYGEEMAALLDERPLTVAIALDTAVRAFDAHLHPELVTAQLAVAAGGTLPVRRRSPRLALMLALLMLLGLMTWALAQPRPFVPLILPIGSHASPEAYARSELAPELSKCVTSERDGIAGVFCVNASGTDGSLVVATRASTLGWMGGGGGSSRGMGPSTALPITVGLTTGWSAAAVGTSRPFGYVGVEGAVTRDVSRVSVVFTDGAQAEAALRDGTYLWFDGRWEVSAPGRSPAADERSLWQHQAFGRALSAVVAYGPDGRELARRDLRSR